MASAQLSIDEVLCHFEDLEDPRSEINRRHPLVSVVVIAIMGVLAQATGPTGIATWAKLNADLLTSLLPLPHGVPGKDVFRRVLCALRPDAFQQCFATVAMRSVIPFKCRRPIRCPALATGRGC